MTDVTRFAFALEDECEKCTVIVPVRGKPHVHTVGDIIHMLQQRLLKKYAASTTVDRLILENGDELSPHMNEDDTIDCFWRGPETHRVIVKVAPASESSESRGTDEDIFTFTSDLTNRDPKRRWRELSGKPSPSRSLLSDLWSDELAFDEGRERSLAEEEEVRHKAALVNFFVVKQQDVVSHGEGQARQGIANTELLLWEELLSSVPGGAEATLLEEDGFRSRELSRHQRLQHADNERNARNRTSNSEEALRRRLVLQAEQTLLELTAHCDTRLRCSTLTDTEAQHRSDVLVAEELLYHKLLTTAATSARASAARDAVANSETAARTTLSGIFLADSNAILTQFRAVVVCFEEGVIAEAQRDLCIAQEQARETLVREYYRDMDECVWGPLIDAMQHENCCALARQQVFGEYNSLRQSLEEDALLAFRELQNGFIEGIIRHRLLCERRWRQTKDMLDEAEDVGRNEAVQSEARKRGMFLRVFAEATRRVVSAVSSGGGGAGGHVPSPPIERPAAKQVLRPPAPMPPPATKRDPKFYPTAARRPRADSCITPVDSASIPDACEPVD